MFKVYKIKTKEAIYKAHICLVLTQACLIHIVTVIKNQKYFKNLYKNYLNLKRKKTVKFVKKKVRVKWN